MIHFCDEAFYAEPIKISRVSWQLNSQSNAWGTWPCTRLLQGGIIMFRSSVYLPQLIDTMLIDTMLISLHFLLMYPIRRQT